jgi:lysophospholipase L1-like esterase
MADTQGGVVGAQGGATGGASQGGEPSAVSQGGTSTGGGGVADGTCPEGAPVPDPNLLTKCSGSGTLQCVFGGDPGHYDVSFLLGGDTEGTTTITAESRRFMFPQTVTAAGESRCVSFTVNVREPEGQPIQDVSPGTPGLNFRLGPEARVQAIGVRPAVDPVVVYIAGDSTVCDQDPQLGAPPEQRYTGWGQMLPQYFGPGVSIANYADSGEGTSAFRPDGGSLWARIADQMGSGDYLLIHLGHNDKTTPAATYASRITAMVQYAKGVGATPVLFSPIARNTGGTLDQQHIYGDLVVRNELSKIAQTEQVAYVDLTAKTFAWMQELGSTEAQTYFVLTDKTHTNELGADLFAQMVVEGLREENVALTTFLR